MNEVVNEDEYVQGQGTGMGLSYAECIMFSMLLRDGTVTLDSMQQSFPESSRQSLIVRLKYLSAKVAPYGYIIERDSRIGRGAKAQYRMMKRF